MRPTINHLQHLLDALHAAQLPAAKLCLRIAHQLPHGVAQLGTVPQRRAVFLADDVVRREGLCDGGDDEGLGAVVGDCVSRGRLATVRGGNWGLKSGWGRGVTGYGGLVVLGDYV